MLKEGRNSPAIDLFSLLGSMDNYKTLDIEDILEMDNVAEELDEKHLQAIGDLVVDGFNTDLLSREPWEKDIEKWTELALQITKTKTYPWPNAANVKYPLLSTAAMQFAARAYPSLVPSDGKVVRLKTIGMDQDGQKAMRAARISTHMNYQLMHEMEDWEEDMDKMLLALPITGTMFKKTYWDSKKQVNKSCVVFPKNLVVNYWARSLEDSERVTEIMFISQRKVKEKQLQKLYVDVDLKEPNLPLIKASTKDSTQTVPRLDETTPFEILEQHTYLDLDGDDYAEPYVVTVERNSRQVLRIAPRFFREDVLMDEDGTVVAIEPTQYYTKFSFVPNVDGGFYDIGFGRLLGTINASSDTLINQLIDAGTLSNMQAGFIGKGLRIKMGESRFQPGEWKAVNAVGDDLKKQIFPLPVRDPSPVLLQLLQFLLQSGKELASVAEIMVGKMPGQNTPATTTMATIEQGMKVFTAVYKRVFRSLTKEYKKLYLLNRRYLNPETYIDIIDEPIPQSDYLGSENDVIPAADPAAVSSQEKQAKAQVLLQLIGLGTINPMAVTQYILEANEVPNPQSFLMEQQPQPDPKMEEMKMKAKLEQQKAVLKMQIDQAKAEAELAGAQQKMELEARAKELELKYKSITHMLEARMAAAKHQQSLGEQADNHRMKLATQMQKSKETDDED